MSTGTYDGDSDQSKLLSRDDSQSISAVVDNYYGACERGKTENSQSHPAGANPKGASKATSSNRDTAMKALRGGNSQEKPAGTENQIRTETAFNDEATQIKSTTEENPQNNPAGADTQMRDETQSKDGDVEHNPQWHEDENGRNKHWLKRLICTLVFSPIKWYLGSCWISVPHLIVSFVYVAKLGFSTYAVFTFGVCRDQLSDAITHGQAVLKHNMLKAWSAEYETLPYPPSIGPFAVYTIEDFIDRINFAVEGFYNMEYQATGHFKMLPNDQMHMHFRYIVVSDSIIEIKSSFVPIHGLTNVTKNGHAVYKYDLLKELEHNNLTDVFNSILDVTLTAALHSLRVLRNGEFLCLETQIHSIMIIELQTTTKTVSCQRLNINATESALCKKNTGWQAICVFALTALTITFDVFSFLTGLLLLGVYHNKGNIKNFSSYLLRWWSLVSVIGDCFIFTGQSMFYIAKDRVEKELGIFDEIAFFYGIGCLLCWIGAMRYLKINKKFSLLFHTIYDAKSNILAFVLCTGTLFVGYWACAFVTFGVYHPKFETKALAAESLFALIYADDIFKMVSSVHYELAGSEMFLKASVIIVIYSFVILFTLLALNLIIALINTSYSTVKEIDDISDFENVVYKYFSSNPNANQYLNAKNTNCPFRDGMKMYFKKAEKKRQKVLMFDYLNAEANQNREEGSGIFMWLFYPNKYKYWPWPKVFKIKQQRVE